MVKQLMNKTLVHKYFKYFQNFGECVSQEVKIYCIYILHIYVHTHIRVKNERTGYSNSAKIPSCRCTKEKPYLTME